MVDILHFVYHWLTIFSKDVYKQQMVPLLSWIELKKKYYQPMVDFTITSSSPTKSRWTGAWGEDLAMFFKVFWMKLLDNCFLLTPLAPPLSLFSATCISSNFATTSSRSKSRPLSCLCNARQAVLTKSLQDFSLPYTQQTNRFTQNNILERTR